jgi:prophage regulatory protein
MDTATAPPAFRLLRLPAVLSRTGDGRSSHYRKVAERLFTAPVALGDRARAWPEGEVDAIVRARVAGFSDDQLRQLVDQLEAARAAAAPQLAESIAAGR